MATQVDSLLPKCPHCGNPLKNISEEYHSIGTYIYNVATGRFEDNESSEKYGVVCMVCNKTVPNNILQQIEKLLPKPV